VGVTRTGDTTSAKDAVLAPFGDADQPLLDTALDTAAKQLAELVRLQARARARAAAATAATLPVSN
jgi:hypothetical protein